MPENSKPYMSWSAGKDSTALLHLVLQEKSDIKVFTEKDDLDFPGEIEYVKRMQKRYNVNLDIVSPEVKLQSILDDYDLLDDIHSRKTDFSQKYF